MLQSNIRDAQRRIHDIVLETTGWTLPQKAEAQIENVLTGIAGGKTHGRALDNFSQREVTILLADLRGFASLSATHPAGTILELLNRSFVKMSETIAQHHGLIDRFTGDSIMAIFFGEPEARADVARTAVTCAAQMQIEMAAINRHHEHLNLPPLYMGIGVNTGGVMAGLVGSELYSAYTLLGEDVNLTSRIEAFSLRGQVLISQSTYGLCGNFVSAGEPMDVYVKGKADLVRLREVLGIPSLGKELPRQEIRRSRRVSVKLPFACRRVERKFVLPESMRGTILDVGYHGVLAALDNDLPSLAELKLDIDLPLVVYRAGDIYARVVKSFQKAGRRSYGLEFTSLGGETNSKLQLFVQMLLQGHES